MDKKKLNLASQGIVRDATFFLTFTDHDSYSSIDMRFRFLSNKNIVNKITVIIFCTSDAIFDTST